jgi:hypothetical protein
MAQKFLTLIDGIKNWVAAITSSAGAADDGKIPALDSAGKLSLTFLPTGVGQEVETFVASEALSAGNFINKWNDAGTMKVRKADASGGIGKKADGFVLAAVSSAANASVYALGQLNNQLSGLTPGSDYWLSATAGGVTTTAPSTATHIIQYIGKASSATAIRSEDHQAVVIS